MTTLVPEAMLQVMQALEKAAAGNDWFIGGPVHLISISCGLKKKTDAS